MTAVLEPSLYAPLPLPDEATAAADYLRTVAAAQPAALALTTASATFTYADIDSWSDAIAADILAAAAPLDPPLAIVTRDNVSLVPAAIAATKAGRFFVMIDAADPDDRIALILQESGARFCLVDPGPGLAEPVRALPHVSIRPFEQTAGTLPPPRQEPHPYLYVIFTSGTTGRPKGVATRHDGFAAKTLRNRSMGRERGARVIYTALPGFTRSTQAIYGSLLAGATMCAFDARSESLDALAEFITREKLTNLSLTPPLFRRLIAVSPPNLDFSNIRKLRLGADKITVADVETFRRHFPRGCTLERGFASTETGSVFHMSIDHDTPVPGPLVPMGRPRPGVNVWLLDEDGNEVPDGEAGELIVRSEEVVEGYWNQPELTAEKFSVAPDRPGVRKFRTGDLVMRDGEGIYYFVGRNDSRLKIQGRRTDPSEVEAKILATGEVRDVAVVGKSDAMGDLRLVAYVVMKPGHPFDPRAIRAKLRETAPAWMIPSRIFALEEIPHTRAMKVDRKALSSRVNPEIVEDSRAADRMQQQLAAIWSRVIGTPVHVDDDFFDDLGGESVIAAHLVTEIRRATGQAIPLSLLLELNTVEKMAAYLEASSAGAGRLAVALHKAGSRPPLFCVCGKGGSVIIFRDLAEALGPDQPFYGLTHHGFNSAAFPSSTTMMAACYAGAIRKIQPDGPYYLAGYSGGGKIALEIARLMQRAGETVAFVGVLDTAGAHQKPSLSRRLANRLDMFLQRPLYRARKLGEEIARRSGLRLRKVLSRRGLVAPRVMHEMNLAHSQMKRDHSVQPWNGELVVFRARNGLGKLDPRPDLGWTSQGVTNLRIIDVLGDHVTMLTDEISSLGPAVAAALADARTKQTRS